MRGPGLAQNGHLPRPPSSIRLAAIRLCCVLGIGLCSWPCLACACRPKERPAVEQQVEAYDVDHVLRREFVEPGLLQLALQGQRIHEGAGQEVLVLLPSCALQLGNGVPASSVAAQDVRVLQPGADGIAWLSIRQQFGAELASPLMPVWDGKASKQLLLRALRKRPAKSP